MGLREEGGVAQLEVHVCLFGSLVHYFFTMISMPGQVLHVNLQIMVRVQLPKFAIYHVKVLVGKIVHDLHKEYLVNQSQVLENSFSSDD